MHDSLSRIKEVLVTQQHALADKRAQDQGYKGSSDYDADDSYHDDAKGGGGFAGADAKKRRGVREWLFRCDVQHEVLNLHLQRAAPPGRCHSCNRAETPEWRRGPDGARTLCNACGLRMKYKLRTRILES